MNMRRLMKTPASCLRMADGGEVSPWSLKGIANKLAGASAPPMTMTEKFARQDSLRAGSQVAPAPAPVAPQPVQTQGISGYVGNGALDGRMKAAGLRDGGTLRTGEGGQVPGQGTGDKIPALYEPKEFVVSNDMLDAAPGLRDELHTLRGHVLHAKGKTVAEANAQAYHPGHGTQGLQTNGRPGQGADALDEQSQGGVRDSGGAAAGVMGGRASGSFRPTLRALDGFEVKERPWTAADSRAFAPQPGPGNPNVGAAGSAEAQAFRTPPAAAPAAPAAPGMTPYGAGQKVATTWRNTLRDPRVQGAIKTVGAVNAIGDANDMVNQAQAGNTAGAVDSGLMTAADVAGTMAGRAGAAGLAYTAGHAVGSKIYDNMDDTQRMGVGHVVNSGVRAAGKAFGQDWGVDDTAMNKLQTTNLREPRAGAPIVPGPSVVQPNGAGTNQAAYDKMNASFSGDATMPAQEQIPGRVRVDRQANGNLAFSGTDVSGPVSYQGPGSNALPGLRNPGKTYNVMPGMSKEQTDAILTNPDGSRWTAQDEATARANLRDGIDQYRGTSRDARNDKNAQLKELALAPKGTPGRKAALALLTQQMQNDTAMYGHNVTERDNIRTNNTSRTNNELTNDTQRTRLRQEQFQNDRTYNAGRDDANFTQGQAAQKALHEEISSYIPPGPDGKPDMGRAAQLMTGLNAHVSGRMGDLEKHLKLNPNDKQAASELEGLRKRGVAMMDAEAKRKFIAGAMAADVAGASATPWYNPIGTSAVESAAPIKSLRRQDGLLGHDYISDRGDVIPGRFIDRSGSTLGIGGRPNQNFKDLIVRNKE